MIGSNEVPIRAVMDGKCFTCRYRERYSGEEPCCTCLDSIFDRPKYEPGKQKEAINGCDSNQTIPI